MIRTHKVKVKANIASMSLVGISAGEYPFPWGNYFSMLVDPKNQIETISASMQKQSGFWGFRVCNFNCENFEEAMKRFLLDGDVEITMFQVDENYPFVAITDERIPEDWYCLWGEYMGYCNGQIHGEDYKEVSKILGKRFGGYRQYT